MLNVHTLLLLRRHADEMARLPGAGDIEREVLERISEVIDRIPQIRSALLEPKVYARIWTDLDRLIAVIGRAHDAAMERENSFP